MYGDMVKGDYFCAKSRTRDNQREMANNVSHLIYQLPVKYSTSVKGRESHQPFGWDFLRPATNPSVLLLGK